MNNLLQRWKELTEVRNKLNQKLVISRECLSMKISNEPNLLLITSKKQSCEEEFVIVNALGENVFAESDQPSDETNIHLSIYQQLEVNCVLQIQTVNNTIVTDYPSKCKNISLPQSEKYIPIIEKESEILQYISDCNAVFMRNHGVIVWGNDIEEVITLLHKIEFQCEYQLKLMMLEMNRSVM